MLVSPAEPASLKVVGKVSSLPEKWGADFLFAANGQWVGVQRKTISDLIASLGDGRLRIEVAQLQRCHHRILIVEGKPQWTGDGELLGKNYGQPWTRRQFRGLLWSIMSKGVWIERTDDTSDTIQTLAWIEAWFLKGKHRTLDRRPGPVSPWGKVSNREYALHLLMGINGMGPELAERILDRFGVPFGWRITESDLLDVDGIGKKKARMIYSALEEGD